MTPEYLHYAMVIEWSDEDLAYIVTVPELPGLQTHASSYVEAAQQGQEVIELWIQSREESGRPIPVPLGRAMALPMTFADGVQWMSRERVPA